MVFDNFEKREREIEVREGRWEEVNFGLWRQKNVLRSTRGETFSTQRSYEHVWFMYLNIIFCV